MIKINTNDGKALNPFFFRRNVLVLLFVFLLQNLSAQIYISEGVTLHTENKESLYLPETENQSSSEIYITSGTIVTNLENNDQYEIIAVAQPEIGIDETFAHEVTLETASAKNKEKEYHVKTPSKEIVEFSNSTDSRFFFAKYSKTVAASFSGGASSAKIAAVLSKSGLDKIQFLKEQSDVFLYSNSFVSDYRLTSFSVRPPPVI